MPMIVSAEQLLVESTSIEEVPTANGGKSIRTSDTLGRAALAHILFADEIWKAEPRVLQTTLDLSKGDGVRHEGQLVKTPLLAFLAASNELPDPEGNLGAAWSRMTIRVLVNSLDRTNKINLVKARLRRDRANSSKTSVQLTLDEVKELRQLRPSVEIPDEIINIVLDIYQELINDSAADFQWAWDDDRRFGRVFDVLQANALLNGRTKVAKSDLAILEWLLWDTPEQIGTIKAKLAPYTRTPLTDAQELVDALLSPNGVVNLVLAGNRGKGVEALTQCESAVSELKRLEGEATDSEMRKAVTALTQQVENLKQEIIAVVTGVKKGGS
jgi:MoxR-like ATPase